MSRALRSSAHASAARACPSACTSASRRASASSALAAHSSSESWSLLTDSARASSAAPAARVSAPASCARSSSASTVASVSCSETAARRMRVASPSLLRTAAVAPERCSSSVARRDLEALLCVSKLRPQRLHLAARGLQLHAHLVRIALCRVEPLPQGLGIRRRLAARRVQLDAQLVRLGDACVDHTAHLGRLTPRPLGLVQQPGHVRTRRAEVLLERRGAPPLHHKRAALLLEALACLGVKRRQRRAGLLGLRRGRARLGLARGGVTQPLREVRAFGGPRV
eukprot:363378-Chlamydomonas_euryale.AAC.25